MDIDKGTQFELSLPVTFFDDTRAKIRASNLEIMGTKVSVIGVDEMFVSLVMETVIPEPPNMIQVESKVYTYAAHAHFQDPQDSEKQLPVLIYRVLL
jgi:hypothetical protein